MKNKLLKLALLTTVFAMGAGLTISANQKVVKLEAAQHSANYSDYTYSGSYYSSLNTNGTDGLNGTFKSALASLILPKAWYTYGGSGSNHLSTVLQSADQDPTNSSNMVYLYTRDSVKKNAASSWNREHVWPQSLSNGHWGTDKAGTDLLHIRPTYNDTNSDRGNKLYGDTNGGTTRTYNGMTYGYTSGNYFEPLDSVKGDVARIVMYVWTAYNNYYSGDLSITNTFASYDTLLKWHTLDKPDALEGNRNNYSQTSIQENRNPFVDHPEYAWRIFGNNCSESIKNACMQAYPGDGSITPSKDLQSIAISGEATKKVYYSGDSFDPTGLTVTATYTDSTTDTIPANNCTWTPNPLVEGTTTVTCTYQGKTATYNGITVNKNEVPPVGDGFSVTFKTNSGDDGTRLDGAAILANQVTQNTLIKSIDSATNIFAGKSGLKFGSSSSVGEIKFTLVESARTNIVGIEIKSTKYGSDAANISLKIDNDTISNEIVPGTDYTKAFNSISATSITIATTTKRAYLNSITINIAEDVVPPDPGPNSSQPPVSSEQPVSSSEQPVSSEAPISSSAPVSSETPISSSEQVTTSENYGTTSAPTQEPEQPKEEEKGCNGSIVTSLSLVSVSALLGLVFVLSKKKH